MSEREPLDRQATRVTSEARMVLPGVQAILGFQLVGALNARFKEFSLGEQRLHLAALVCVALAMGLVMAPAAYHRIAEFGAVSRRFIMVASVAMTSAMVPLALGVCLDIYLIARLILDDRVASAGISAAIGIFLAGLWFGFPLLMRARKSGTSQA